MTGLLCRAIGIGLLAGALLLACGGTGADPTATPLPPTPTPTAPSTATPSPTPRPPTATPTLEPPTATATNTPTQVPLTVVAPPRSVATQAPPRGPVRAPTLQPETPTPIPDSQFQILAEETFDDSTRLFVGETQYGIRTGLVEGYYGIAVPEGAWQNIVFDDMDRLDNGIIQAYVELEGRGAVGLVARSLTEREGTFTFYVCWLDTNAQAGCTASVQSQWVELFRAEPGTFPVETLNELVLIAHGTTIYFEVNGTTIGMTEDTTSSLGAWGLYAEGYQGTFLGWFDSLLLARLLY
jgi:hypothetical protein